MGLHSCADERNKADLLIGTPFARTNFGHDRIKRRGELGIQPYYSNGGVFNFRDNVLVRLGKAILGPSEKCWDD